MSLRSWAEYGWLKEQPTSPQEIRDLLGLVARGLADAKVEAISDDLRFQAAWSAALTAANVALRASGYRTNVQVGHHQRVIESLEFTVGADPKLIQKLRVFSKKRNVTSYDAAGGVSAQELEQALLVAEQLQRSVNRWLKETHPKLIASDEL